MSQIPASIGRVPSMLSSQLMLRNITGTSVSLLNVQEQLATGRRVNRTSDDPTASALIILMNSRIEQAEQRSRNLDHASGLLATADQALSGLTDSVLDAKTIASSQVGVGSDADTRALEAEVIASLRQQIFDAMNSDYVGVSLFAGSKAGSPAFEFFKGGYRYLGDEGGLETDLGDAIDFPLTLDADKVVGATSTRVQGDIDLNPLLTAQTFLKDLRGPMTDKTLGTLNIQIDNGATTTEIAVDVADAETISDLQDMVAAAVADVMGAPPPVTLGVAADRLVVNVDPGYTVTFDDGPAGSTAQALALDNVNFTNGVSLKLGPAADLNPRVSNHTTLADLNPATAIAFGDVRFRNGPNAGVVTVDPAMTIAELRQAVNDLDLGIEVDLAESGDGIDVINHVAGLAMSVEEVAGGQTATTLGIRSFKGSTLTSTFNNGAGVEIAHGVTDPGSGLPDPAYNDDFQVTLSDGATTFTVDLAPADIGTVDDVLAKINADAAAQGLAVPGQFVATLAPDGNGIVFTDTLAGPNAIAVTSLNGYAAEDLGLLDNQNPTPGSLNGADTAQVEVDSLFTTLLSLEQALENDDVRGITFAGGRLETDLDRLTSGQALIGTRAARIETATTRLEDQNVLDTQLRSELRDLDFVEATSRFSLLQTQLQAALTVTAQSRSLSLINFLG